MKILVRLVARAELMLTRASSWFMILSLLVDPKASVLGQVGMVRDQTTKREQSVSRRVLVATLQTKFRHGKDLARG
jgi:hypothetical protein